MHVPIAPFPCFGWLPVMLCDAASLLTGWLAVGIVQAPGSLPKRQSCEAKWTGEEFCRHRCKFNSEEGRKYISKRLGRKKVNKLHR